MAILAGKVPIGIGRGRVVGAIRCRHRIVRWAIAIQSWFPELDSLSDLIACSPKVGFCIMVYHLQPMAARQSCWEELYHAEPICWAVQEGMYLCSTGPHASAPHVL